MAAGRTIRIKAASGVELALLHVPSDDTPITVEVLEENIWRILELEVAEVSVPPEEASGVITPADIPWEEGPPPTPP